MPNPTIAATLIVRDEARCISRCLSSVVPWVDRIVVVDTGSVDETPALARRAGAEVHHFGWPDDFSAARNHALSLADADWHLVIDADEWIERGGDTLRGWCATPGRLGRVCIHSDDEAAGSTARNWVTRLVPRGARFTGRVHEQVASPLPRERTALQLGHDGYRAAQLAGKRDRNHALLLAALADDPGDPYLLYQLGKDAGMRGDHTGACGYLARAMASGDDEASWRHDLVVCTLVALKKAGRLDEALALADVEMPRWAESPDFFFMLGDVLLDRAISEPARALAEWLPLASGAWERCLAIGERPDLEGSVAGRGSDLAQHNLAVIRGQVG